MDCTFFEAATLKYYPEVHVKRASRARLLKLTTTVEHGYDCHFSVEYNTQ